MAWFKYRSGANDLGPILTSEGESSIPFSCFLESLYNSLRQNP